jgi:hypothetical protein
VTGDKPASSGRTLSRESTPSRLPIDSSKIDNEEMALIIKSFRQILKHRRGRTTNPAPKGCATNVVSPVISLLNVQYLVKVTRMMIRERRKKRRGTTRRRAAMPTCAENWTPTRAPLTPPPTRTPPTSPSTKASSSPTLATNVSWPMTAKIRRYNLEPPPSIQHLVMRVVLVKTKMIYLLFLLTSTWNKNKN